MDERKIQALFASSDCRYDFKGSYRAMSKAEEDNWWARQELVSNMRRPTAELDAVEQAVRVVIDPLVHKAAADLGFVSEDDTPIPAKGHQGIWIWERKP